jgi:hypothetical protein
MEKLSNKLSKLKGRSFDELRVRGSQAFASLRERRSWTSDAKLPSDEAFVRLFDDGKIEGNKISPDGLLEHFRNRTRPFFFAGLNERESTVAALRESFGGETEKVLIEKANRICDGYFDLLGFRGLHFGEPLDWHLEPISNKRSPLVHWSLIDEIDPAETGDKKIVWELNRHQHFITLGRAYWRTNDERYAETFVEHLCSWMDQNPPKLGVNWLSSLEISFRSISWVWAFYFFKDSPHLSSEIFWRALKFLYLHARHLEKFLSIYSSPNTHLTGEALGLFYLGLLLPELKRAKRWQDLGQQVLFRAIDKHILSDGVYFERASYYQRYTVDFYLQLSILLERNSKKVPAKLKDKLQAALDHLMLITRPDGTTPLYGDDDGGRLTPLDERPTDDYRAALATGAAVFNRGDYKFVAKEATEEIVWLLGAEGFERFQNGKWQMPNYTSAAFPEGGYYVMRDDWSSDANFMLIDCGPHGFLNCGHAHADALSFDMVARGKTLLVDSGTFIYTADKTLRDWFRSSQAHNTVTIDGESSSVPAGPFSWNHVAECVTENWISNESFDFFSGSHDGYMRLSSPAKHRRNILFLKKDYWIVLDAIETTGEHNYELNFHLAPNAKLKLDGGQSELVSFTANTGEETAFVICCDGSFDSSEIKSGWVSTCYGVKEKADVIVCRKTNSSEAEFVSFMLPIPKKETKAYKIETNAGKGFRIEVDQFEDILLLGGNGETIKTESLVSNFKWTWARFSKENNALEELALIEGSQLSFDGRTIINFDAPIAFAHAKRNGDELRIETDKESFRVIVPLIREEA